ncbi:MAG: PKD domain-containing protein [Flavobacteriales bacterium]|nr:PKD domain-containing protein [Flavobacteriales bacterium]
MKRILPLMTFLLLMMGAQAQVDSTGQFIYGCTDPLALNYNPQANVNDGSCIYDNGDSTDFFIYGCTDSLALNFNPQATIDDGSCMYDNGDSTNWFVYGCTDPLALNYNPQATIDDGSCVYDNGDSTNWFVYGCTDPLALNYNLQATIDDGSCVYDNGDSTDWFIYGCTDPLALNYNPQATIDDGLCVYDNGDSTDWFVYGCTDPLALNYNPQATIDDGSCVYDNGDSTFNDCNANFEISYNDSLGCELVFIHNLSSGDNIFYNWSFGDGTTSTEQFPSHEYESPGYYGICLEVFTNDQSCYSWYCDTLIMEGCDELGGPVQLIVVDGLPLNVEQESTLEMSLYPNPVQQTLNVQLSGDDRMEQVAIFSIDGRVVRNEMLNSRTQLTLDVADLPQGIYLVKVWG